MGTNIHRLNLLPSYNEFRSSLDRFKVQRFQNAASALEKEERNVNGQKMYFKDLSVKDRFGFTDGQFKSTPCDIIFPGYAAYRMLHSVPLRYDRMTLGIVSL